MKKYCRAVQATDDNITQGMRSAHWITEAKYRHSEYVILIAFPLQQWIQERPFVLRYMYIACLLMSLIPRTGFKIGSFPFHAPKQA